MKLLTNFKQSDSTHILDHIHEWRCCHRLVKNYALDQLLARWFTKYFLSPIKKYVAKGGIMVEEKFIARAQYLDLVYTQSGTLYDNIPNIMRP